MYDRKALFVAGALALAAGIVFVPAGTFARGGGFAGAAHGPMFGFPGHRAFRPAFVRRAPARLGWHLRWWNLHRLAARNRAGANAGASAVYPGVDGGYAPAANDLTGSVAVPEPALLPAPSAPYPPEHVGCLSRGYDVASESGGVARVTVTRC